MSATSGTSSVTSGTLGDAAPVSFPGIASGIDYNSIIEKYTADTLSQEKPTQSQINNLNSQNTAITKITSLIGSVQDALTALSNPTTFGAYKATVSNTSNGSTAATTSQISGQSPVSGTYSVDAQKVATATSLTNDTAAANANASQTAALVNAGLAITPTNGTASNGSFTINGIQIQYNVNTDTLTTIISKIQTVLTETSGGTASISAAGVVSLTGVTSLGSGADSGNLEQVLKLDNAQLSGGDISSSAPVGGVNENSALSSTGNAGFTTGVTAGTFTINGVQFTVNPTTDTLSTLLSDINSSSAGVTAVYNPESSSIQLTSNTAGPQSILLGASSDTSNFLQAAGFVTSYNTPGSINPAASLVAGTQASLTYTNLQGQTSTVYSNTNDFTTAIPGIDLNINTSSPVGSTSFYTVTVATDPTQAEAAINKFITAYNAAITALNTDTAAPTVSAGTDATTGTSSSTSSGGGVLYGNYQISGLRDQLVQLVSGFVPSGSSSYNSLQSVGILLDTNSQSVGTSDSNDSSDSTTKSDDTSSSNNSFSVNATSGQLQALDTTTFEAAYAANTIAVKNLFTLAPTLSGSQAGAQPVQGSPYGFSYLLGSSLANIDGLNTYLANDTVVTPDNLSNVLLTNITDSNNQQIDSLQQSITLINNEATQQADQLRAQFTASETQIAELQALQQQIAAIGH